MEEWGSSVLNMVAVSMAVIAFIFYMNRLLGLVPYLFDGILRSSPLANIEASVRLTRDRNALAGIAVFALCLLASRYDVYDADFLVIFQPGIKTLVVTGVLLGALLLRVALVHLCAPRRRDNYIFAASTLYDFLIVGALLCGIAAGLLAIFGANDTAIRTVMIYVSGLVWGLFLIRRTQILGGSCSLPMTILYVLILEIIPAGALVASAILF